MIESVEISQRAIQTLGILNWSSNSYVAPVEVECAPRSNVAIHYGSANHIPNVSQSLHFWQVHLPLYAV